jgi:Leucine-rich repeat (LRR) protein
MSRWRLRQPPRTERARGGGWQARTTRELDLAKLQISAISTPLQQLDQIAGGLVTINCAGNNVQDLPRAIGMCAYLQTLILKDNRIASFPQSTKQMVTLTHLDISGNQFTAVPDMLTYTPRIRFLDMSRNAITSLYRRLDTFTAGGFQSALTGGRRAKEKEAARQAGVGRLRRTVAIEIMDQVQAKLQSANRSRQVGALFQLHALQTLAIAANAVNVLPGTIARFTALTSLDMSNNGLPDVPPDLGSLTVLTHLNLSYNKLLGLPQTIATLCALRTFDVSHNGIRLIPVEVGRMTSLRSLDISSNDLVFLPVELEALETSLTTLRAEDNNIRDPPLEVLTQGRDATFTYFRRVRNGQRSRDLVLIDMHLQRLDLNWHNLTVLTALELSGNEIDRLPKSILQLTNLLALKASGNRMTTIVDSEDISPLSALTRLTVKGNLLPAMQAHLSALVHLKDLDVSCNLVEAIEKGIEVCTRLRRIQLAENQMSSVPKFLFRILDMQFLNVSYNHVRTVPFAMCFCVELRELDLSYNRVELLPQEFGNLVNLEYFNLNSNLLRQLPECHPARALAGPPSSPARSDELCTERSSFRFCTALKSLLLNDNKLATLPPEIRRLKNLQVWRRLPSFSGIVLCLCDSCQ